MPGVCIFIPFFLFSIIIQVFIAGFSIFGLLYAALFLGGFIIYCYLLYHPVYKGAKTKYPIVPPEGERIFISLEPTFQDRSMKTCGDIPNSLSRRRRSKDGRKRKGRNKP